MKSPIFILLLAALLPIACKPAPKASPLSPAAQLQAAKEAKEYFDRGNYSEAEKTYERILAAEPNDFHVLSNLGVVRFRVGKLELAAEALQEATVVAPNDGFSHCMLGIVFYSQGRYDDAMNALKKALTINPNNVTAYRYLGMVCTAKGWHDAARNALERAQELDPSYGEPDSLPKEIPATFRPNDA